MKKGTAVIGIIVLIVGLVLISRGNIQQASTSETHYEVEHEWSISGYFSEGDNLSLYFVQYGDWSYPVAPGAGYLEVIPYAGVMLPSKTLQVNVTNVELNNYTLFEVTLVPPINRVPIREPYNFVLNIFNITVTHHGAITVEDTPDEVRGIVKNDGSYFVNLSLIPNIVADKYLNGTYWHHPVGSPSHLRLYRTTTKTDYPYTYLLPAGILVSVTGATILIWSVKSWKQRITSKEFSGKRSKLKKQR